MWLCIMKRTTLIILAFLKQNRKYIIIYSHATLSSEIRILDASVPSGTFKVFQPRMKDVIYQVVPIADKFLIRTNKDGARNFKLMECSFGRTGADNWKEVIPVELMCFLKKLKSLKDFLVFKERKQGLLHLLIKI